MLVASELRPRRCLLIGTPVGSAEDFLRAMSSKPASAEGDNFCCAVPQIVSFFYKHCHCAALFRELVSRCRHPGTGPAASAKREHKENHLAGSESPDDSYAYRKTRHPSSAQSLAHQHPFDSPCRRAAGNRSVPVAVGPSSLPSPILQEALYHPWHRLAADVADIGSRRCRDLQMLSADGFSFYREQRLSRRAGRRGKSTALRWKGTNRWAECGLTPGGATFVTRFVRAGGGPGGVRRAAPHGNPATGKHPRATWFSTLRRGSSHCTY